MGTAGVPVSASICDTDQLPFPNVRRIRVYATQEYSESINAFFFIKKKLARATTLPAIRIRLGVSAVRPLLTSLLCGLLATLELLTLECLP